MNYIGTASVPMPTIGTLKYDTTSNQVQAWDGNQWVTVSSEVMINQKRLIVEEVTFGGTTFYTVEPSGYDWNEVYIWVRTTFGEPRTDRGGFTKKWFISGGTFWFDDQKHRDWLVLRWSGDENS